MWEAWLRDLAVDLTGANLGDGATDLSAGAQAVVPAAWRDLSLVDVLSLWEAARETADRVLNNVNPRLAVEVFLADAARGHGATTYVAGVDPFATQAWQRVALS